MNQALLDLAATVPVFDSHFHIIDRRFPLVENQGFLPDDFTCRDYLERTSHVNLTGGAVVSGSFQALDQSYLEDALATLGPRFVGVTQLPAGISDQEVLRLNDLGVRAVRFNIKRGGSEKVEHLDRMARRVYDLARWHVELYVDARELPGLRSLTRLPAVSIDHLGLSKEGLPALLSLVERGVRVKATGFGRVDFDVSSAMRDICSANPDALIFGTDLPSTRAPRPYRDEDLLLVLDSLDLDQARKVLAGNAIDFYRLDSNPHGQANGRIS